MRFAALFVTVLILVFAGQRRTAFREQPPGRDPPSELIRKRTGSGLDVGLIDVTTERDAYRWGACPPGDSGIPDRVVVPPGSVAVISRWTVRVLSIYKGQAFPKPILRDRAAKQFRSEHSFVPAQKLVGDLQGGSTELGCEFPFLVPAGTQPASFTFEDVSFEVAKARRGPKP